MRKLVMGGRWLVIGALCAGTAFAECGVRVAVLNGRGDCDKDFDGALTACAVTPERFACSAEGMADFVSKLDNFDLALVVPLFNYAGGKNMLADDATDSAAIRGWLEKGGVLMVSEANYLNVRGWVEKIAPEVKGLTTSKCTSSQWEVKGFVRNEQPAHPVRTFPNVLGEGDSWPHFDEPPSGHAAQVLARCSEGKPVSLLFDVGRGAIVLTTLRQPATANLENYLAFACLKRAGLKLTDFSMSPLSVGAGKLKMELADPPAKGVSLELAVTPAEGEAKTFPAKFSGRVAKLKYRLSVRGDVSVALNLVTPDGKVPLFVRRDVFPDLVTVQAGDYRGILSTARRVKELPVRVSLAPDDEDLAGAKLSAALTDGKKTFAAKSLTVAADKLTGETLVKLELPKDLPAGDYTVQAEVKKGSVKAKATCALAVLAAHAAQCVIDLDRTFLVGGKPFFPLGLYHAVGDYQRPMEIGFDSFQYWKWEVKWAKDALPTAEKNGLHLLFECNHWGDAHWKDSVVNFGKSPALLMWEVDDEPSETSAEKDRICNAGWHKYDREHPTSLTSCRTDLFAEQCRNADVFAFDPYGSKETPFDAIPKTVDWCRKAQSATKGRQPLMLVAHAFPSDPAILRPVAFVGLVHDVRAIFWYCWKQTSGGTAGVGLHEHPECQEEFTKLLAEIRELMPALLAPRRKAFEEGAIHGLVTGSTGDEASARRILLVNTTGEKVEADFKVPGVKAKRIQRTFAPYETAVEKW